MHMKETNSVCKKQGRQDKTEYSKKKKLLSITDFSGMRLCPIAPPKGFPIALWKPSDAKYLVFLRI